MNYAKSHALSHLNGQIYESGFSAVIMTPDILERIVNDESYTPHAHYRHHCINEHKHFIPYSYKTFQNTPRVESQFSKPIWINRSDMAKKFQEFINEMHTMAPENRIVLLYHNMQAEVDSYEKNGLTAVFRTYYDNALDTEKIYKNVQGPKGSKTLGGLYAKFCSGVSQMLTFHNPLDDAFATQALVFSFIRNNINWLKQLK